MLLVAPSLLALAPTATACPLDSLVIDEHGVSWSGLRVGASFAEIGASVGGPLAVWDDLEWSVWHARVVAGGGPAILDFPETAGFRTLSGIVIEIAEGEKAGCGSLDALRSAVFDAAPPARYVPSRHDPDVPQARSEGPMYMLDDRDEVVVLLARSMGTIYVGRLGGLD